MVTDTNQLLLFGGSENYAILKQPDMGRKILKIAAEYGFCGKVWQVFISWLLLHDENPFSLACERKVAKQDSLYVLACSDIGIIRNLYQNPPFSLPEDFSVKISSQNHKTDIGKIASTLSLELEKTDSNESFLDVLVKFYQKHGVGVFGLNKAFYLEEKNDAMSVQPISEFDPVRLADLWLSLIHIL